MQLDRKIQISTAEYVRVEGAIQETAQALTKCVESTHPIHPATTYRKDLVGLMERLPLISKQLVELGAEPKETDLISLGVPEDLLPA